LVRQAGSCASLLHCTLGTDALWVHCWTLRHCWVPIWCRGCHAVDYLRFMSGLDVRKAQAFYHHPPEFNTPLSAR
jgi:hypothetical protein